MAECPTDFSGYQEEIKTITFQGDDEITIPKIVREQAYQLAIDVIIRSIPRETYKNYTVNPAESFFGNAVIVSQDAVSERIPIKFPRQRVYEGRVPEAFQMWNDLVNFEYHRSLARDLCAGTTVNLGVALGFEVGLPTLCCSLPPIAWRELSVREVFFAMPYGTQYEVEISWIRPVAFSDFCGTLHEGNSGQVDGDKDTGLPSEGSFPRIAPDPDNPYNGLPPRTPDSEQLGFSGSKTANIDDTDPVSEGMYTAPADRPVRLLVTCNFASTSATCVNDVPQTAYIDMTYGDLNEPYTPVYNRLTEACGGFYGVAVEGGCFGAGSCGKVGSGGAVVSWFYL